MPHFDAAVVTSVHFSIHIYIVPFIEWTFCIHALRDPNSCRRSWKLSPFCSSLPLSVGSSVWENRGKFYSIRARDTFPWRHSLTPLPLVRPDNPTIAIVVEWLSEHVVSLRPTISTDIILTRICKPRDNLNGVSLANTHIFPRFANLEN